MMFVRRKSAVYIAIIPQILSNFNPKTPHNTVFFAKLPINTRHVVQNSSKNC